MFTRLIKKTVPENRVNGCKVVKRSKKTKDFPFCSHVLYLNKKNQIGIEYNDKIQIRIDGVATSGEQSFIQMMDALIEHAKSLEYGKVVFCDALPDDVLEMFLNYGFVEAEVEQYNHYLHIEITERSPAT